MIIIEYMVSLLLRTSEREFGSCKLEQILTYCGQEVRIFLKGMKKLFVIYV